MVEEDVANLKDARKELETRNSVHLMEEEGVATSTPAPN
jgi:hypothetical protein